MAPPSGRAQDLPDRLALPLASGAEWWYWLGGRPAIDLVNTLRERWRRRVETLVTPADLGLWLVRADLAPAPPRVSRALLDEARELREAIDACVRRARRSRRPPRPVGAIDGWLAHAGARPRSRSTATAARPRRARARRPGARALGRDRARRRAHARDAAEAARIRVCASDTCSARFYDRSPAGRRRWCSMALCGNEAKARRHRARARSAAA
jgi:predicted RNA-binding Zn ribbon-like protein